MTQAQQKKEEPVGSNFETPRLEYGKALLIAGLRGHFTTSDWQGIPAQWQRFVSYLPVPGQVGRTAYGLCFMMSDGVDYLSGVEVKSSDGLPAEFKHVSIPAQKYAVFTHRGHVSQLRSTLDTIWQKWLPASGHEVARPTSGAPDFFERYTEDFNPQSGMGGMEVWIPIKS
jgi:AraC family transcriptional regulator